MAVSFEVSREDADLIMSIATRAHDMEPAIGIVSLAMDVAATHVNGCPLKLFELLKADDLNFTHDVFGIVRHINRDTGKLMDMFLPRYAKGDFKW